MEDLGEPVEHGRGRPPSGATSWRDIACEYNKRTAEWEEEPVLHAEEGIPPKKAARTLSPDGVRC